MLIAIHTLFGIAALLTGAWNLLRPKGTFAHRRVGRAFALSMYALVVTSFFIFEVFGRFGAFHVLALVSGATLTIALYFPVRRRHHAQWLVHHYFWISYSYVGLVMATGSHFFDLFPQLPVLARAALFWGAPYLLGTALIFGRKRRVLAHRRA